MTFKEFLQALAWLAFAIACLFSAATIGEVIPGGWGTAAAFLSAFFVLASILALVEHVGQSLSEASLRRRYGALLPDRLPMGRVLQVQHRSGAILDASQDTAFFALGRGHDKFFLVKQNKNAANKQRGGSLVFVNRAAVDMPYASIVGVDLIELSQEEINNNSKDNRAWEERAGEAIAARLTGVKLGKIVPYACFLELRANESSEIARIVAAYPTEIDDDTLNLAKVAFALGDALIDSVSSAAGDATRSALGIDALGLAGDVNALLLSPGRASGKTNPDRARLVGRMMKVQIARTLAQVQGAGSSVSDPRG